MGWGSKPSEELQLSRRGFISLSGTAIAGFGVLSGEGEGAAQSSGDLRSAAEEVDLTSFGYGGTSVTDSGALEMGSGETMAMGGDQSPYLPSLSGRIESERFDSGGEGVSYHDTDATNSGGAFRDTGVDIQKTADVDGEYNIGWIEDGEWWEYTRECARDTYEFTVRVASPEGGSELVLRVDGTEYGRITVPKTDGWQSWTTESFGTVDLAGGVRVVRLEAVGGGFNVNWFAAHRDGVSSMSTSTPTPTSTSTSTATPTSTPTPSPDSAQEPFGDAPARIPGRIQAEHYDRGGEGEAYHDTDPQWSGRPESDALRGDTRVDLQATADNAGRYNVGRFDEGEWLEYTVDPVPGPYDLRLRVATPHDGRQLRVKLNGDTLRTVDLPNTGSWSAYRTVVLRDVRIDTDRTSVLRVESLTSGVDFNWLDFDVPERSLTSTPTPTPTDDGIEWGEIGYGEYGYGGVV